MMDAAWRLDARSLASLVGGTLLGNPDAVILGGKADSRLCRAGDLFVALPGERDDGSRFIASAWDAGATVALAGRIDGLPEPPEGKALVLVDDALRAVQSAAAARRKLNPSLKVVGITGSNGKTTTKDVLSSIVRQEWGNDVLVTRGNYNSDIGLPLMLLELRENHRYVVLEMGMNRPGELAELASIARPDIGVITNIGSAHIGILGSRQRIAEEKRSIFRHMGADSVAVIAADESWAELLLEGFSGKVRRFGRGCGFFRSSCRNLGLEGFLLQCGDREVRYGLPGEHNLLNAMAAVEAALALGVSEESICRGLESAVSPGGRSEVRKNGLTVIRDAYNANPESLTAALRLFSEIETDGRRVLVLGEMLELGAETEGALHAAGGAVAEVTPDALFLYGKTLHHMEAAAREAGYRGELQIFTEIEGLKTALGNFLRPGDFVLLKGSRGSALERLDEILEEVGAG